MSVCVDVCHIINNVQHHEFLLLFLIPIRCVVDSVVTLLLQLDGEEAVTALQTNMDHMMNSICRKNSRHLHHARFLANI